MKKSFEAEYLTDQMLVRFEERLGQFVGQISVRFEDVMISCINLTEAIFAESGEMSNNHNGGNRKVF